MMRGESNPINQSVWVTFMFNWLINQNIPSEHIMKWPGRFLGENLKIQNFDPSRYRTHVSGVIDSDTNALTARPFWRWIWTWYIWKYKLERPFGFQSPGRNVQNDYRQHSQNFDCHFYPENPKTSNIFSDSENLYQSILRGVDQFARIFKSWNSILRKLLIYQYLYIHVIH